MSYTRDSEDQRPVEAMPCGHYRLGSWSTGVLAADVDVWLSILVAVRSGNQNLKSENQLK